MYANDILLEYIRRGAHSELRREGSHVAFRKLSNVVNDQNFLAIIKPISKRLGTVFHNVSDGCLNVSLLLFRWVCGGFKEKDFFNHKHIQCIYAILLAWLIGSEKLKHPRGSANAWKLACCCSVVLGLYDIHAAHDKRHNLRVQARS